MDKRYLVGIVLDSSSRGLDGSYKFVYHGEVIHNDKNILHVSTEKELTDSEIIERFSGTYGFKEIVRE